MLNSARMLAGLIFAVQDAEDRPDALAATLPFAGLTLIEYQARLLIAAGVSQLVVVVARLTPELLGAVARIGRRGVTVDTVRTAAEATAKLHPLSHLLVLADGLVTTESVVAGFARDAGEALLVIDEGSAAGSFERIGGGMAWAGVARLDGRRLAEVAAMPRDYDVQSALLHAAGQAGAALRPLPHGDAHASHGIERRAAALEARSNAVMAASVAARPGWFDRWIVRPIATLVLPPIMRRHVPATIVGGVAAVLAVAGLGLVWSGQMTLGLLAALVATIAARLAAALAWQRDEPQLSRPLDLGTLIVPALAALLLGHALDAESGALTGLVIAIALVAAGALGARAAPRDRPDWWGVAPAYLLGLTLCTALGAPTLGLAAMAAYATVTLAAAIEALRQP